MLASNSESAMMSDYTEYLKNPHQWPTLRGLLLAGAYYDPRVNEIDKLVSTWKVYSFRATRRQSQRAKARVTRLSKEHKYIVNNLIHSVHQEIFWKRLTK